MTAPTQEPPSSRRAPVAARGAALPGGPGFASSPTKPGGKTPVPAGSNLPLPGLVPSSPARGRAAQETPGPETGALPPLRETAPVRARVHPLAAAMSEADLLSNVTGGTRKRPGLCKLYGLTWYHTHNSKHSPSGFPDLVIAGRTVIYRELKRQKENPTKAQREWIAALEAAGADVDVWRPADWYSGRIVRELTAISSPRVAGGAA